MRFYQNENPTIGLVRQFEEKAEKKGRRSLVRDAEMYAEELGMKLDLQHPLPSGSTDEEMTPPWYSPIQPKPVYENNQATAHWGVPVYAYNTEVRANRVDARFAEKGSKIVTLLEMSWKRHKSKPSSIYDKDNPDWAPSQKLGYDCNKVKESSQERYNRAQERVEKRRRSEGAIALMELSKAAMEETNNELQPSAQLKSKIYSSQQRTIAMSITIITHSVSSKIKLYADDTKMYRELRNPTLDDQALQVDLNSLGHWARTWQLRFNEEKCEAMRITHPRDKLITDYILEVRKEDGQEYPGKTLYEILSSIQMYLRVQRKRNITWIDKKGCTFRNLNSAVNFVLKERARQGIGVDVNKANLITHEQENYLWQHGFLGSENAELLCDTLQLVNMDSQEKENISQFTTDNSTANPGDVVDASAIEGGSQSWNADVEIEIPEEGFEFVLTEWFCQDPVEEYFGGQWKLGRCGDNPDIKTFGYNSNTLRMQRTVSCQGGNTRGRKDKTRAWEQVTDVRLFTSKPDLQRLDISSITNKATSDSDILANYNLMISDAELEPDSHVCKDVFRGIVSVYVHVHSFSFAKDVIQHYKIKATQTKARALRKEIIESCQGDDQQRQE
ncbi:hypothetical protein AWC38_SpisGene11730 [Stylophora pistillata]|uniref:Reverse transcriptase domain-containing protein n=1 Tax=Stylophora pistillata TaxID=50429 RepID=A0A2B4S1E0_STYPI|nr:hypothetical protein AWC38_SpisGene11730 [Stylophora pistillata]